MPNKWTNSTITWFNSPLHGNQDAQTLVNIIQIKHWYRKHQVSIHYVTNGATLVNREFHQKKEVSLKQVYCLVVKFWNIEESILHVVQSKDDYGEEKEFSDDESDSEGEDSEPCWDEILPPQAPTFKVDCGIDITSQALWDMVSTEHSVGPSAPPQCTSSNVHKPLEYQVHSQIGIGRLWRTFLLFFTVFKNFNHVNNIFLTC